MQLPPDIARAREAQIIQHIKGASFVNPRMLARQWGITDDMAKRLYENHYNKSRAC